MSFFKQFPKTTYDLKRDGNLIEIKDIFRNVDVNEKLINPASAYQYYYIQDGERPDQIANKLYGNPRYYWTLFIANDRLKDGYMRWPMSYQQLQRKITEDYNPYMVLELSPFSATELGKYANPISSLSFGVPNSLFSGDADTYTEIGTGYKFDSERNQLWLKPSSNNTAVKFRNYVTSGTMFRQTGPIVQVSHTDLLGDVYATNVIDDGPYIPSSHTTSGNGSGAEFSVTHTEPGTPSIVTVTNGGTNYAVGDTITLPADDIDNLGDGSGPDIIATITQISPTQSTTNRGDGTMVPSISIRFNTVGNGYDVVNNIEVVDSWGAAWQAPYYYTSNGSRISTFDHVVAGGGTPVTYSEWLEDENEKLTAIRVVKPNYIAEFAEVYKEYVNS